MTIRIIEHTGFMTNGQIEALNKIKKSVKYLFDIVKYNEFDSVFYPKTIDDERIAIYWVNSFILNEQTITK